MNRAQAAWQRRVALSMVRRVLWRARVDDALAAEAPVALLGQWTVMLPPLSVWLPVEKTG